MKKFILLTVITLSVFFRVQAQCDLQFNNLSIQATSLVPLNGNTQCQITFNASFDITTNSGFKYLFFHSWLAADYPNPPIFNCGGTTPATDPGTHVELGTAVDDPGKSFMDAGFINLNSVTFPVGTPVNVTANIATTYPHDATVVLTQPSNSPGLNAVVTRTSSTVLHFDVTNIRVIINQPCGSPVVVKTDIWGSNQNSPDPKAQCYVCANNQNFADPSISGFRNCNIPRQYAITISTTDPVVRDIVYKVYLDMNNNGSLDGADQLAYTSGTIQISAPGGAAPDSYSSGLTSLPAPYSSSQPWADKGYLIQVSGPTLPNSIVQLIPEPGCIPLPVDFKSFTAARTSRSNVLLKWETFSEQNSNGFAVERNTGNDWQQVAFVPTQAQGGNSNAVLAYQFNDQNTVKGITQYRIRQVDLDARSKLSEIRAVRGEGQTGRIILYPNPSATGIVNVVFEDGNVTRDVSLMDMTGRMIRQIKGITNNNIQIDNLMPGVYSLRVVVRETGDQSVEKLVVNKR